jgi:hypothetical protein
MYKRHMKSLPEVIPPRSRVRLVRFDKRTPVWHKDVGRQFRVGYYSRKDGLYLAGDRKREIRADYRPSIPIEIFQSGAIV